MHRCQKKCVSLQRDLGDNNHGKMHYSSLSIIEIHQLIKQPL